MPTIGEITGIGGNVTTSGDSVIQSVNVRKLQITFACSCGHKLHISENAQIARCVVCKRAWAVDINVYLQSVGGFDEA